MRILYLCNSIIPSRYANSVQVMKMCQALAQNGHEVTLLAQKGQFSMISDFKRYNVARCFNIVKYPHLFMFSKHTRNSIYTKLVDLKIKKIKIAPDIIYSRNCRYLLSVAKLGLPLIYEAHTSARDSEEQMKIQEKLFQQKNFIRLVVISGVLRDDYIKNFPWLPMDKIVVAHAGADLSQVTTTEKELKDWPGRPGSFQVGYVGHLYPGKGLEIITEIAEKLPQVDLHIIGGRKKDIQKWKKMIHAKNIYFHGFVWQKDLNSYYQKLDTVLLPYIEDRNEIRANSPLKLFEYMGFSKSIVASDLQVLREILHHGENSLLASPNDPKRWVEAINQLASDSRLRERLAAQAFKDVSTFYTWNIRAQKVLKDLNITGK